MAERGKQKVTIFRGKMFVVFSGGLPVSWTGIEGSGVTSSHPIFWRMSTSGSLLGARRAHHVTNIVALKASAFTDASLSFLLREFRSSSRRGPRRRVRRLSSLVVRAMDSCRIHIHHVGDSKNSERTAVVGENSLV
jgi:hypothetical protein